MFISAITGITTPVKVSELPKMESMNLVKEISKKEVEKTMSTESYIRQYFKDVPIMVQIARCESQFTQFNQDGSIHRGVVNDADVGVMQINEFYHLDTSEDKNYNIYTLEGNTAYARNLYERQGTQPWSSSKPCWGKYESKNLAISSL